MTRLLIVWWRKSWGKGLSHLGSVYFFKWIILGILLIVYLRCMLIVAHMRKKVGKINSDGIAIILGRLLSRCLKIRASTWVTASAWNGCLWILRAGRVDVRLSSCETIWSFIVKLWSCSCTWEFYSNWISSLLRIYSMLQGWLLSSFIFSWSRGKVYRALTPLLWSFSPRSNDWRWVLRFPLPLWLFGISWVFHYRPSISLQRCVLSGTPALLLHFGLGLASFFSFQSCSSLSFPWHLRPSASIFPSPLGFLNWSTLGSAPSWPIMTSSPFAILLP